MCCLYFGSSRERFALLKSLRMIKTESGCFGGVGVKQGVKLKCVHGFLSYKGDLQLLMTSIFWTVPHIKLSYDLRNNLK